MSIMAIGISALVAFATLSLITRNNSVFATAAPVSTRPSSPLDEAERILARRYATGEITAEAYERMLVIVRR